MGKWGIHCGLALSSVKLLRPAGVGIGPDLSLNFDYVVYSLCEPGHPLPASVAPSVNRE